MANINAPFGLRPVRNANGNAVKVTRYIAAGTVYEGSPVCLNASFQAAVYTEAAALAGDFLGVCANAATAGQDVWVYDDPDTEFDIQTTGTAVAAVDRNLMYIFANPTAGSSTTNTSTASLDGSTAGVTTIATATAASILRFVGFPNRPNNEQFVANMVVRVKIVPPYHANGMGGTGISATGGVAYNTL